ncbi:hypothetical protein [Nostoc sp.]|uniref:hypothetical protein n=1 Tax=Nostoc sp. TaxID=1180 RepID=UPI002FFCC6B9
MTNELQNKHDRKVKPFKLHKIRAESLATSESVWKNNYTKQPITQNQFVVDYSGS